jgi:hypothetical protein
MNTNAIIRNSEYARIIVSYLLLRGIGNEKIGIRQSNLVTIIKRVRGSVRKRAIYDVVRKLEESGIVKVHRVRNQRGQVIFTSVWLNQDIDFSFLSIWARKLGYESIRTFLLDLGYPQIPVSVVFRVIRDINRIEKRFDLDRKRMHALQTKISV